MNFDLLDEQVGELDRIIENDRYFLSPRILEAARDLRQDEALPVLPINSF
jgi:hypothetical protein